MVRSSVLQRPTRLPTSDDVIFSRAASVSRGSFIRHKRSAKTFLQPADATPASEAAKPIIVAATGTLTPPIRQRLRAAGFTLVPARTVSDVGRFLADRVPVAVFLGSSDGAGVSRVVRWLRSQERLAFVQLFVLSKDATDLCVGEAIAAGADDVLHTQCGPDDATDRIVARIQRFQSLSRLTLVDPLTELYNRRFMNDRLPAEVARAARIGSTLSLALVDLDEFKAINDTFGHAAGDRALVAFARAIRSDLRAYDVVCRFGGDEFVVLFPDCGAHGAHAALAQLRARHAWALPDLPVVTFSAGVAQFPEDGDSWSALFEVADENIRRAKAAGRSRTVG
jgi:two-component system cell cycle response regulator